MCELQMTNEIGFNKTNNKYGYYNERLYFCYTRLYTLSDPYFLKSNGHNYLFMQ